MKEREGIMEYGHTSLLDSATPANIEVLTEKVYEAARELIDGSEFMRSFGGGDQQRIDHTLEGIFYDFDYQHIYGMVYGMLLAVTLGRPEAIGEVAQEITDFIIEITS
jgi:hypothetical protein